MTPLMRWLLRMVTFIVCLAVGAALESPRLGLVVGVIAALALDAVLTITAWLHSRRSKR
jgi:hypothetical protein